MKSMKRWMGYAWLLVMLWAGVWAPDAGAQDARNTMAAKTLMTRSSPFDPPMEDAFTADAGAGLDTGCTFNDDPEHPLVISVLVDRYVGEVDGSGFLVNPGDLVSQGIIPATVDVIMPAFDVDVNGSPPPEQDAVLFNGEQLGLLNGDNQIWLLNSFTVDISKVKFPASPGGGPAVNQVQINVDILSSGRWCTAIDWVSLILPIEPVVAATLTSGGNGVRELPDDIFWEQSLDTDCEIMDEKTDLDEFPFSGPSDTDVSVETELTFCPSGGSAPEVKADWNVAGTSLSGSTTFSGATGTVSVRMPEEVGIYTVEFDYEVDGEAVPTISRKLFVTKGTPLASVDPPRRVWYERAVAWGAGEQDEADILQTLLDRQYAFGGANWRYGYFGPGTTKCPDWRAMVDDPITCDYSDCYIFSSIFESMAAVLGIGGLSPIVVEGTHLNGFVTSGAPSVDPAFTGNTRPFAGGAYDRYLFSSHSLRLKGDYYDATFNGIYSASDAFIAYNLTGASAIDADGPHLTTDEGAKIYPLPGDAYDSWGNSRYKTPPSAQFRFADKGANLPAMTTPTSSQAADIQFTGAVTFVTPDDDANGFAEKVVAQVEVEVLTAGTYSIYGQLSKSGNVIANRPFFEAASLSNTTVSGAPGIYTVDVPFSGEQVFRSGEDGPYDATFFAIGTSGFDQLTTATPAYTHTQFGEVGAVLAGASDIAVDDDDDGRFDAVETTVHIMVRSGGTYRLQGALSEAGGGTTLASASDVVTLGAGSHTVMLRFDGQALRRAGIDGPYDFTVSLLDDLLHTLDGDLFTTQAYTSSTFGAVLDLDGTFNDQGVDTNANGLFDLLRITFGADVTQAGPYLLSGSLTAPATSTFIYTDAAVTLATGGQTLTLNFSGSLIREKMLDGPYEVEVVLRDPTTLAIVDRVLLPQQTAAYAHTNFDPFEVADILLTGNANDMGVDIDSNGLFDELHVDVEVALTTTDFYQWSARLVDANGTELDFDARSGSRSAGTSTINFVFDGEAIGANGVDGPYFVRGLLMFGNTGANIVATDVAETSAYSYQDFEGSVLPVTLTIASEEPDIGVDIAVSPLDLNGEENGITAFERTYALGTEVTLTAADTAPDGNVFLDWQVDGTTVSTAPTLLVTMDEDRTVVARYTVPLPHPFVLLADEKLDIDSAVEAEGDIHSNDTIDIKKGNPSIYVGTITAVGAIKIGQDNTIDGDVMAGGVVDLDDGATVTGTVTEHVPVATIPVPALTFSAGGDQVTVDMDGTLALSPGSYSDVKVEAGGTLLLAHDGAGGDYFFEKLDLKKEAILSVEVTQGPVAVNVVQDINLDKDTQLAVTATNHHGSRYLTVHSLEGHIDVKENARLQGSFIAPEGTVSLDKEVLFQGGICARDIAVKNDALLYSHVSGQALPAAPERAAPKSSDGPGATEDGIPTMVSLKPNYPNPFNPVTMIAFELSEAQQVTLDVYDVVGRHVATLVDGRLPHGVHEVTWDAHGMSTGVYYYRLQGQASTQVRQMVLLK